MGLEASLKLLDLPPNATIEDANQAYACLHRMIDLFHQETGDGTHGNLQEDMELLTCAYEKAVAYLSDQDHGNEPSVENASPQSSGVGGSQSTDLHFTINFDADTAKDESHDEAPPLQDPNHRTVEEAISITTRRIRRTESDLPDARQAVDSAATAVASANRRHESVKQASLAAAVAAESAKSRTLLLEIEAKRAMEDAIAIAEKARDRVVAARKTAQEARGEADRARKQVSRVRKSEEIAAAEVVCAEDHLEKVQVRLKEMTHTLVESRSRMAIFQDKSAVIETKDASAHICSSGATPDDRYSPSQAVDEDAGARQQILSDLLEIEASLNTRTREPIAIYGSDDVPFCADEMISEKRQHCRLAFPIDQRPVFSIDGRSIPILDLSSAGMCLEAGNERVHPRIVRGAIAFPGRRPIPVTGKVVRADDHGLGLKLVTRIGNHILDQERLRLSA